MILFSANAAAAAGGIIFFCSYIPYGSVSSNYDTMSTSVKLAVSLDFNLAMSLGLLLIGRWEGAGRHNSLLLLSISLAYESYIIYIA